MRRRPKKLERDWLGLILIIGLGAVVAATVAVSFYRLSHRPDLTHEAQSRSVPPFYASAAEAQPLPATLEPNRFPGTRIKSAYAIARQKPAVLAQQPCYCGCDRQGHRSLLDCFANEHAASCSICIREAEYANGMDAHGKCAAEIRTGIIRGDWKSLAEGTSSQ